jgi:hypothetical protein
MFFRPSLALIEAAWVGRVETAIDPATGLQANFISADDLIASKLASGLPQDLADADALRKAIESGRLPTTRKRTQRLAI